MRTVSGRIALLTTALCGLVLGAFAAGFYLWVGEEQRRALDALADAQLRAVTELVWNAVERGEPLDVPAYPGPVKIERPDGSRAYATPGFDAQAPGCRLLAAELASLRLTLGVPTEPFERPLRQLRMTFAVFLPATLLLAAALAQFGARRALAPLEDIRRQAERISRQNVSERIPLGPLYGELFILARTFNEMLDRLDRAIQDLQSFAADAAHELRTPLANLRAEIETAARRERSLEEHERILASAAEEVSRMSHIVSDLLTLARMDLRQHALKKEPVRLRPLLEDARETWQPLADERGIRIELEDGDAEVSGDPGALRRVFMNLLHNAVKYNRDGGEVRLGISSSDGRVRARIRDSGIGIPPEQLPNLFRRFFRVDAARSRDSGGAGLGLAICKSFVEAHEGSIDVQSEPDRGTTFTIDLPALARPAMIQS